MTTCIHADKTWLTCSCCTSRITLLTWEYRSAKSPTKHWNHDTPRRPVSVQHIQGTSCCYFQTCPHQLFIVASPCFLIYVNHKSPWNPQKRSHFPMKSWNPVNNQHVPKNFSICCHIKSHMGMDQYLLIPFLGGWTSIYQLFWCSPGVQGFDTMPYKKHLKTPTKQCINKPQLFITSPSFGRRAMSSPRPTRPSPPSRDSSSAGLPVVGEKAIEFKWVMKIIQCNQLNNQSIGQSLTNNSQFHWLSQSNNFDWWV